MRKQANAEQWQEQNHHLDHHKLNLIQEEQGSSEAGLTHEQLALVDMYKSENLIGGKYFDPSVTW